MVHNLKMLKILLLPLCLAALLSACNNINDESNSFVSEDQEKFLGTWSGEYGCGDTMFKDEVIITNSPDDLGFDITIHANMLESDVVKGTLEDENVINVPEQIMGGFPGTAKVIYSDDATLTFSQSGFGVTCNGINYVKKEENKPPIAHAGDTRNVSTFDKLFLDSSKSTDPNSDELSFSWSIVKLPEKSLASLSDVTSESPFLVPDLLGLYVFSLIVSDGELDSAPHEVSITVDHVLLFSEDFSENDLSNFLISEENASAITVEDKQLLLQPKKSTTGAPYITIDTALFIPGYNSILNNNNAAISYAFNLSNVNAEVCGACNNMFSFNISSKNTHTAYKEFGYSISGGGYTTDRMIFNQSAIWSSQFGLVSNTLFETEGGLQVEPSIGAFKLKFYPSTKTWELYFEQSVEKINPTEVSTLIMSVINDKFTNESMRYISFRSVNGEKLHVDNISISLELEGSTN